MKILIGLAYMAIYLAGCTVASIPGIIVGHYVNYGLGLTLGVMGGMVWGGAFTGYCISRQ